RAWAAAAGRSQRVFQHYDSNSVNCNKLVAAGPKPRSENAETEPSLAREVLNEVLGFASPDETYFHTLAVNSEHCTAHIRYNFHFHDTQGNFLYEASQLYT
ncbi:unnamed protein product, partial [Polarella glacialis]